MWPRIKQIKGPEAKRSVMTLHIVYVIYSNNTARCISLFQGSQGEILGFAKPITFYVL